MGYKHIKQYIKSLLLFLLSTLSLKTIEAQLRMYDYDAYGDDDYGSLPSKNQKCIGSKLDIIYVVDGSGSVGRVDFERDIAKILKDFSYQFDIGPNTHHLAYIQFSTNARVEFQYLSDQNAIIQAISDVSCMCLDTNLKGALETANSLINDHSRKSQGVKQMVLVVSDGESDLPPEAAADALRNNGVEIFALGYSGATRRELETITSRDKIMLGSNINDLKGFMEDMVEKICTTTPPPPQTTTPGPTTTEGPPPTTQPPPNPCDSAPCQNDGTCSVASTEEFFCECSVPYKGVVCEERIDYCETDPCGIVRCPETRCSDLNENPWYKCDCGCCQTGEYCLASLNECESDPCQNGGTCVDGDCGFVCVCTQPWTGDLCTKLKKHVTIIIPLFVDSWSFYNSFLNKT